MNSKIFSVAALDYGYGWVGTPCLPDCFPERLSEVVNLVRLRLESREKMFVVLCGLNKAPLK